MSRLSFARIALLILVAGFIGSCAATAVAPSDAELVLAPEALTIAAGVAGDEALVPVFVGVKGSGSGVYLSDISVNVFSSSLRVVDPDGNLSQPDSDSFFTYTTDENGRIELLVEIPLGEDGFYSIQISSGGGVTAELLVTVTAAS